MSAKTPYVKIETDNNNNIIIINNNNNNVTVNKTVHRRQRARRLNEIVVIAVAASAFRRRGAMMKLVITTLCAFFCLSPSPIDAMPPSPLLLQTKHSSQTLTKRQSKKLLNKETRRESVASETSKASDSATREPTGKLQRAAADYQASLVTLLELYRRQVSTAYEKLETLRRLSAEGLIARREVEQAETVVANAQRQVTETEARLSDAAMLIAEASVEEQPFTVKSYIKSAPPKSRALASLTRRTAYFYSPGKGVWSLAEAASVQRFFENRFGRVLPVSAFGQSATHNRLGFDHHNAMDVAVHPDSSEGQSLIAYLTQNNIPFFAFRQAVTGSATGAHIHIGARSHRLH